MFPPGRQARFTIGRDPNCDLVIADISVSRRHAGLARGANGWLLTDLGSTNGTRLNGWRVRDPVPVRCGDRVSFGAVTFELRDRALGLPVG
jgi:pSer/pThr/pTyr-binding forkhead associated (FHA) protein